MLKSEAEAISLEAKFRINSPRVAAQIIEGEAILVNLATGSYYSMVDTGAEIWAGIEAGRSVGEMVDTLRKRYGASKEVVAAATRELIERLIEEDLIRSTTIPGPAEEPASLSLQGLPSPPPDFAVPVLEKYDDMKDLVLLDPIHEVGEQGWPQAKSGPDKTWPV